MIIRKLKENEIPPMDLLLLADPSEDNIKSYINKSEVDLPLSSRQL